MSVHMELDGKGAFLTRLHCAKYGNKTVYSKVFVEHDGIERQVGEHFWELNDMLTTAGYDKPNYGHSKIITMPRIPVLLEAHDNHYRIQAITDVKGKPIATRQQVIDARDSKRNHLNETPFVFSLYKGDREINDWLVMAGYNVKPILHGQYQRNGNDLNKFKRVDGNIIVHAKSVLKAKEQSFRQQDSHQLSAA